MQLEEIKQALRVLGLPEVELDMLAEDLIVDVMSRAIQSLLVESPVLSEIQQGFSTGKFSEEAAEAISKLDQTALAQAMREQGREVLLDLIDEMKAEMTPEQLKAFEERLNRMANRTVIDALSSEDGSDNSQSILQNISASGEQPDQPQS